MHIGIIGAGNIGATLARKLTKLGHSVALANSRGPDTLKDLAGEIGAVAVEARDAAKGADILIVTIPEKAVPALPKDLLASASPDLVVIDTGNYYPMRDGRIDAIEDGAIESQWVADHIGRPVIKVFNSIGWTSLADGGKPAGSPGRIALPVAGDDPRAKQVVLQLVDALGFDPVDAGSLVDSWRQQPGSPVYCTDYDADGVRRALGEAKRERSPIVRDESLQKLMAMPKDTTPAARLELLRSLR